ncbi:MAG: hypothetical protein KatS3mg096_150 [Candidatus Parcubacteria bacterium]|nr:MAG: hypothetical protein KatS3mg096_150 [Candidatus Parcubacteria bacterium]
MKITKEQKAALIGMILGDGYLQSTGKKNARLRLEHRAQHYEYLVWKMKLLPQLFQGKPKIIKRQHPLTKRIYSYVRCQSNSSPLLGKLRRLFYQDGQKKIPENIEKLLIDDLTFAIWFYDDGYYSKKDGYCAIYLGKISFAEAKLLSQAITNKFNLKNKVVDKKNKGFMLYFPASEKIKIKNILQKYFVPIMSYKIPS